MSLNPKSIKLIKMKISKLDSLKNVNDLIANRENWFATLMEEH